MLDCPPTLSWLTINAFTASDHVLVVVAHVSDVLWGTAYAANQHCQVSIQDVQSANACAVTPTYVEREGETNVFWPPAADKPLHRLVATALALPPELKGLDSAPALYGDVIYLLSRSGNVVALGR